MLFDEAKFEELFQKAYLVYCKQMANEVMREQISVAVNGIDSLVEQKGKKAEASVSVLRVWDKMIKAKYRKPFS